MDKVTTDSSLAAVTSAIRAFCEAHRSSNAVRCPECNGSGEVEREGNAGVYTVACRCNSSGGAR